MDAGLTAILRSLSRLEQETKALETFYLKSDSAKRLPMPDWGLIFDLAIQVQTQVAEARRRLELAAS